MSTETQSAEARANEAQLEPLGLAGCAVLAFAVIDGCIWVFVHSMSDHPPPEPVAIALSMAGVPLVTAQIALAAIWLVFAWPPLPLRMLTALVPVTMVAALFWYRFSPREAQESIVGLSWFTLALALPCGLARAIGCEVRQFRTPSAQAEWLAVRRPRQFTLRQMFAWTSAVALLGGLGRLTAFNGPMRPAEWIIFALIALIGGGFAQATVWSALGEKNPWVRLSFFALLAFGLGFILTLTMTAGSPFAILIAMVFSGMVYATGGALLIFRANGFRYVRARNRIR